MTITPSRLKRWTRPDHYAGASWPEYYSAGVGQSRDSGALERSNFACMLSELGGESDTVRVIRESHWAVGWVEWIAIHESDSDALEIADRIRANLDDYAIINEEHFSNLEFTEMLDYWSGMSIRERAEHIADQVRRHHWLKPSLMRYRRLLRADYSPGSEDGLSRAEVTVSLALEQSLRD